MDECKPLVNGSAANSSSFNKRSFGVYSLVGGEQVVVKRGNDTVLHFTENEAGGSLRTRTRPTLNVLNLQPPPPRVCMGIHTQGHRPTMNVLNFLRVLRASV